MKKTNLGIIGLGYIGKLHLRNSLKLENVRVIAVSDISKTAIRDAKKLGVSCTYQDYTDLLKNPDIDAVIIALPTHLHKESAKTAAENEKHIFMEKPLARNTVEAEEILSVVQKHGVKLMIGHPDRFVEENRALKTRIEKGELGEIQVAYATSISSGPFMHRMGGHAPVPVPDWWWKKELTGGGVLIDLGSHKINLLHWFFGDVTDAKSYLGYRYNLEQEDHAICTLKFKQGQIGIVNVGWFSQQSQDRLDVYGTVDHAHAGRQLQSKIKTALQLMLRRTTSYLKSHLLELEYFVDCIQKDEPPQNTSGEDALKDLKIIEQAYANQVILN